MSEADTLILPGSYVNAREASLPTLVENLSMGSPWLSQVRQEGKSKRSNSSYYGPATQFIIDCFLHIAEHNPDLAETRSTPYQRGAGAEFIIRDYIGEHAVGPNKVLAITYASSDMSRTLAHLSRFQYLQYDREHVLLGAYVPFVDVSRVGSGAALFLRDQTDTPEEEIADVIARSKQLYIIGGIKGDKTAEINVLSNGAGYTDQKYFKSNEDSTVGFTDEALEAIRPLLSKLGCPTAKINTPEGKLFSRYWGKIAHFLLDQVDYDQMQAEIESYE